MSTPAPGQLDPKLWVEESAWVCVVKSPPEHMAAKGLWYGQITADGFIIVTNDNLKATRFSRKEDSDPACEVFHWRTGHILESQSHAWVGPRVQPSPDRDPGDEQQLLDVPKFLHTMQRSLDL